MINDFNVPVTYFGGTGGHFLISFLNAAYLNDHTIFKYSIFGNAHNTGFANVVGGGLGSDAPLNNDKIKILLSNLNYRKFIGVHITEYNLLLDFFTKIIKITYQHSDIAEISKVFAFKWDSNYPIDHGMLILDTTERAKRLLDCFSDKNEEGVICVSWVELYKEEPRLLIEKLSKLFVIPIQNFNVSNLLEWRKITNNVLVLHP